MAVQNADKPLIADKSGSPDGYVLYVHPQDRKTATIDVARIKSALRATTWTAAKPPHHQRQLAGTA